jgi:hypothetical protein
MSGRAAVHSLRSRLVATFDRVKTIQDPEVSSDFARYLCVLVSGYLEQAVIELVLEHVRRRSGLSVQRYVEARLSSFTNANSQRLLTLLGSFDPDWRRDMEPFLVDELKDAVDSIVNLRNTIAHGRFAGVTFSRVSDYYKRVDRVVTRIADLCAPSAT